MSMQCLVKAHFPSQSVLVRGPFECLLILSSDAFLPGYVSSMEALQRGADQLPRGCA